MAAESTSWTLILGAAAECSADRDAFCLRYAPVISAYLAARWRLPGDHPTVSDAVQDVFVQCFKDGGVLDKVDPQRPGGFRAFLYGVVKNVALMAERAQARRRERGEDSVLSLDQIERDEATLSQAYDRAWALLVTREAGELMIRRVAEREDGGVRARVLELKYDEGLPPRDISAQLGVDVEVVYRIVRLSRKEFRTALVEVMGGYHPGASEEELEGRCADLLGLL